MTPTASPTAPVLTWSGADIEPSDAFVDALVAMLANVVEKRAAAGEQEQAGRDDHQHGGTDE